MSPLADSQFSPPCPFCGRDKGRPTTVTMKQEERIIKYVCRTCSQPWTLTDPAVSEFSFSRDARTLKQI